MAVTVISSKTKFMGLAGDTKPTTATHRILPGATFYAHDTGILYITHNGTDWVEKDTIVRLETSPTIDIGDVTLLANSGVDIGDVDVTSVIAGTGATNLGKAEDAAHTSGDTGVLALGVRNDDATSLVGTDKDYAPVQVDRRGGVRLGRPVFGEASLAAVNNGSANWAQGLISPLDQKSPTGWLACLYGGVQTGDDWARVNIPVDELLLTKFTGTSEWTYWMTNAESMGVGIVLWVHDPTNLSKRADISQMASVGGVGKAAGWNRHQLNSATTQFMWYGENITGSALTSGTQYTLAQFIADVVFSTYTIYRITIEYGWDASGTLEEAFVADIVLNGIPVLLKPDSGGTGRVVRRLFIATSEALAGTIAPKTPFRLLSLDAHVHEATITTEVLTLTKDAGYSDVFDTLLFSDDLLVGARTSIFVPFGEGWDFLAEDEIDLAQLNSGDGNWGVTIIYQTVFS